MSSKYYHTQRQSSSIKGLLTPLGGWDSHFSRHQPIIPSREPSPFKGIFPKNRWSWKLFFIALKPYPSFGGQESFLILQESQTPLFQHGRILSSLLDIPRPVPLYYISCLLGSVCGVDFLLGYLYFLSTLSNDCIHLTTPHQPDVLCEVILSSLMQSHDVVLVGSDCSTNELKTTPLPNMRSLW